MNIDKNFKNPSRLTMDLVFTIGVIYKLLMFIKNIIYLIYKS